MAGQAAHKLADVPPANYVAVRGKGNPNDEDSEYKASIDGNRMHHEIYLSDPRKTSADKLKTVIRYPVKA
ncbi:MAG: hypothetical protein IJ651_03710 [Bacteroidales bacterium]|nr:hypothetical protein [Bacteroidales bacterium]